MAPSTRNEVRRGDNASVVILGSGPNRIGQGIEFDYCCVHAAMTVRELGRDAVMVNCNPETVSTDYDTSDRLYFEPLTADDVLAVIELEQPEGVIVQFGAPAPLRLARALEEAGVTLLGTPVDAIDLAEDRGRFGALLRRLDIRHPPYGTALSADEAAVVAADVGFPLLVRPSYVLGGRAMEICYSVRRRRGRTSAPTPRQTRPSTAARPLPRHRDRGRCRCPLRWGRGPPRRRHAARRGGRRPLGRLRLVLPPMSLGDEMLARIAETTRRIAIELGVIGLINIQYAVADGELYVIEANPRASRTVPFVSKAIGAPIAKIACRLMLGEALADQHVPDLPAGHVSVKEAVLPFSRFAGADTVLGPEMKSTGEVMGVAGDFPTAFGKAQAAAGVRCRARGHGLHHGHRRRTRPRRPGRHALRSRLRMSLTRGTARLSRMGVPGRAIHKIAEGLAPRRRLHRARRRRSGHQHSDRLGRALRWLRDPQRRHARDVPCITTMTGASAVARAVGAMLGAPRARRCEPAGAACGYAGRG